MFKTGGDALRKDDGLGSSAKNRFIVVQSILSKRNVKDV